MNFEIGGTQALVQGVARDYAVRCVAPRAAELDASGAFPHEPLRGLADLGLMAINVPSDYGGAAAGTVAFALAVEEIARACASTAVLMSVTNMVGETIARYGTESQKRRYLPQLARGDAGVGSFALSEPSAGSDPAALRTTAAPRSGGWVLDGRKQWITGGAHAFAILVWARTAPKESGTRGISCFLVDGRADGLHVGRPEDKMGIRASHTVPIVLDGCRIGEEALLGELDGGFKIAMTALDGGRIGIGAQAVGIAGAALDESVAYARVREAFGVPIGEHQAIRFKLADMRVALDASRFLVLRAAEAKQAGKPFSRDAAIAKLFASESAVSICNDAVQIHGGYGYVREFAAERHLRDARVTTIYEGTSEIQRTVIARSALG
ncbi:MAG TPA: acyl-CoA dehydrogenase family protein [Polyangiaceae bacterium]|nr:acyl-CoA dehydrogenase family protein [Polyangiaceae bacterium]